MAEDDEDYGDIIHRMMLDLDLEDAQPGNGPRCDGCGKRLPLQPYVRTTSDGGSETLYYCADCRAQAILEE
jgi:hypothetical protein